MPPPLPYFKVNICPFSLPHFALIFFAYLWSFRWPNYIVQLTINVFWTGSGCIRFNDWKVDVRWIFMSNSSEGVPVGIFKCGSRK
jgi:hypothetical protein